MNSNDEALDSDEREWRVFTFAFLRRIRSCLDEDDDDDDEGHIDANEIASDGEPEENVASGQEGSNQEEEEEEENNDDDDDRRSASPTKNNGEEDDEEEARGKSNWAYAHSSIARCSVAIYAEQKTFEIERERPWLDLTQRQQPPLGEGDCFQFSISVLVASHVG